MEIGDDGEISDELLYNATPCLDEGTQCLHLDSSLYTVKFNHNSQPRTLLAWITATLCYVNSWAGPC